MKRSSTTAVALPNRFERRRERTRQELLAAATRVLAEKGLHETKVTDIAAAADVGVGTFYLHFPDKETLFDAVVEETVHRLKATVDAARERARSPLEKVVAANRAFFRFARDNREVFKIVFGHAAAYNDLIRRAQALFIADTEAEIVPDCQIPVYDTHIWQKMTPAEIRKLRRESLSWTLSQFMHGEQGALLATAQITTATPWIESKFYAASQVMDEARHVEVYSRYLREKLSGAYPINRHLKTLLDQILTDSRWDMKYLGMQIMVEGLAMAAFGYMHKLCQEPLLTELTHYVMRDEARHVAFGVLSLNDYFWSLTAAERREREEFLYEGCRLMRDRLLMEDVWEVMGWPVEEVREIVLRSPQMQEFRKMLFSKIVPNVKRLGLLSPYVRERFAELGILQFENEEPSA